MAAITVAILPAAVWLFLSFSWWLALGYGVVWLFWFLPRFILMLHNTSHRQLFKRRYRRLNLLIPWAFGPFFGESPETYYAHHIGMHHPENNLEDDLSSTMRYQRDSVRAFAHYFFKFFVFGLFELASYHRKNGRKKLFWRTVIGESAFYLVAAALLFINWRASLVVFLIPITLTRFLMMAGNWGQHAFIVASAPGNCYLNSITCINTPYNHKAWNDGYHIGHHIKPNRHWTDMPSDFLANLDKYADEGSLVFQGLDYFQIWLLLMLKQHRYLATRIVQLGEEERSVDELVDLLKRRLEPCRELATGAIPAAL